MLELLKDDIQSKATRPLGQTLRYENNSSQNSERSHHFKGSKPKPMYFKQDAVLADIDFEINSNLHYTPSKY